MAGSHAALRPRSLARRLAGTALAVSAAVVLAVSAAGGTSAYLSSSASAANAATLKSGTATLEVGSALALPATVLYPGATIAGSATVNNTGDVPLTLRVTGVTPPASPTPFSSALTLGVSIVASAANCTASTPAAWTGVVSASSPPGSLGTTAVAAHAGATVCMTVTLPLSAPAAAAGAGASAFTVTLNGLQKT